MRKFILKLSLFTAIPLIMNATVALLIPLNLFTFRSWEALHVFFPPLLDGPFYPNQQLEMIEVGDLGKGTPYAIPRSTLFVTDQYGYRNTPKDDSDYDIVIIGDSMTVGSGLTQTDTLAESLTRQSHQNTYNYAPAKPGDFLSDARFEISPPDTVILQVIERELLTDFCPQTLNIAVSTASQSSLAQNLKIFTDRAVRNPFYLQAYIRSNFIPNSNQPIVSDERMVFFDKSLSPPNQSSMIVEQVINSIQRCKALLANREINFIFLPVPDKENVFFDMIPAESRPPLSASERSAFLRSVITAARENEIDTVDLLTPYLQARDRGIITYQMDDTHWNKTGIAIAVEQILPLLDK